MVCETIPKTVRILLLGEPGVGKTSLILSLVSEEFTESVPAKAEEITIPADVTPEQVPTNIVDFSALEQSTEQMIEEIARAHVICIVFAVDKQETLSKVGTYWLPFIREQCRDECKPIVLVGNKNDLINYSMIETIWDITEEYPEVDYCIECSAKTITNVSEMFYNAQKAVLHPVGPIFIIGQQDLTEKCKKALTRVFTICDLDGDGLLSDSELNNFQKECFEIPLQIQVLEEVKAMVAKNVAGGIEDQCVTLTGFLFLHCLFIQKGRNETIWTVLRKFGYDESLELRHNYVDANIKVPIGCTAELTHKAQQFLTQLFERYDQDKDGALNGTELKNTFACCPKIPWKDLRYCVPTNDKGYLTLQGWLCRWHLMAISELQTAQLYLAYLGYNFYEREGLKAAFFVTREKKTDLAKRQSNRNVYQCHIIGPKSCGKTTICRSFLGIQNKKSKSTSASHAEERSVCVGVAGVYGAERVVIAREVGIARVSDPLPPADLACDVACLAYDVTDPRSFEYVARIYIKYFAESKIPVLMVGTKSECGSVRQEYLLQPDVFCSKYQILPPHMFLRNDHKKELFVKLATMAAFPHLRQFAALPGENGAWWKAGMGVAAATVIGFLLVKIFNHNQRY